MHQKNGPNYEGRIQTATDEIIGKSNSALVDEVFTADYVLHAGGKDSHGRAFVKRFIGQLRAAIPDMRVVGIEFLNQAGNTVAWRRTLSGTHKEDLLGIPPSGKRVEWRDMLVSRFDGERIAEEWAASELAGELLLKLPPT